MSQADELLRELVAVVDDAYAGTQDAGPRRERRRAAWAAARAYLNEKPHEPPRLGGGSGAAGRIACPNCGSTTHDVCWIGEKKPASPPHEPPACPHGNRWQAECLDCIDGGYPTSPPHAEPEKSMADYDTKNDPSQRAFRAEVQRLVTGSAHAEPVGQLSPEESRILANLVTEQEGGRPMAYGEQDVAIWNAAKKYTQLASPSAREPTKMEILAARLTAAPFCETCRDMREEVAGQLYAMGD